MIRSTIDKLEMLNPDQLGELLILEVQKASPDVQFIQDILTVGCPIGYRDTNGWTALHHAARVGKAAVLKFLTSNGGDINIVDDSPFEWTPLHFAALNGNVEIIKLILYLGGNIHFRTLDGRTAWDIAYRDTREAIPELEPK